MNQLNLFDQQPTFDGPGLEQEDHPRLTSQLAQVYALMKDGLWRTPREIMRQVDGGEASITARLRDLRKDKFRKLYPNIEVHRRRKLGGNGEHEYRVEV